jgi:predicted DNA-binding WGR domain protein
MRERAAHHSARPSRMQQTNNLIPLPHHIHLQAIDAGRNIARDYRIEVSPDLFGHIVIELHWGRIGTKGQGRTLSFAEEAPALRFIKAILVKRQSAQKRIGIPYRSVGLSQ